MQMKATMPKLSEYTIEQLIAEHYANEFAGVHEAANLFPMCDAETMVDLRISIYTQGLLVPIIREAGSRLLIDGRNRLLACHQVHVQPRIMDVAIEDPIAYVLALNLERRHLSVGQRAMVGDDAREMYAEQAKARQVESGKIHGRGKVVDNCPQPIEGQGKARDKAGAAVGVSGKAVDRARDLKEHAPALAEAVRRDEKSLNEAYTEAKPAIQAAKREAKAASQPKAEQQFISIIGVDGTEHPYKKPASKHTFNREKNDSIDWAQWTWNPVTGCRHPCGFCYARELASQAWMKDVYPLGFEPVFHPGRLLAPVDTRFPNSATDPTENRVFVGSMADLFGEWVPDEWIEQVFKACMAAPQWEYLFLTKWPVRYKMLASLPHAWFGASVVEQKDVKRVERTMRAFETTGVKWVSLEPMREPIRFNDLSWCDLMVIGAQRATNQPEHHGIPAHREPALSPSIHWVSDVMRQCDEAGVPVYLKENLRSDPGMAWPKQSPVKLQPSAIEGKDNA